MSDVVEAGRCLNCNAPLHGPFCGACGQRAVPPDPTVRELAGDAWNELTGYDGRIMADYSIPRDKAADVTQPTIAIAGEASFPFFLQTVAALGDAIPNGESTTLPGQQHDVSPEVLGPVLKEFFSR